MRTASQYGGSAQDDVAATTRWDQDACSKQFACWRCAVLYPRSNLPRNECYFQRRRRGRCLRRSHYTCAACGTVQDVLTTVKASGKTGPMAGYAIQGYAPKRDRHGKPYGGRFFADLRCGACRSNTMQRLRNGRREKTLI